MALNYLKLNKSPWLSLAISFFIGLILTIFDVYQKHPEKYDSVFGLCWLTLLVIVFFLGLKLPKCFWLWPIGIFGGSLFLNFLRFIMRPENMDEFQNAIGYSYNYQFFLSLIFSFAGFCIHCLVKKMDRTSIYLFSSCTFFFLLYFTLTENSNSDLAMWTFFWLIPIQFLFAYIFSKIIWTLPAGAFLGTFFYVFGRLFLVHRTGDAPGEGLVILLPFFMGGLALVLSGLGIISREVSKKISDLIYRKKNQNLN